MSGSVIFTWHDGDVDEFICIPRVEIRGVKLDLQERNVQIELAGAHTTIKIPLVIESALSMHGDNIPAEKFARFCEQWGKGMFAALTNDRRHVTFSWAPDAKTWKIDIVTDRVL